MNFIEAMRHVHENVRSAVKLPEASSFVWFDETPTFGERPFGLVIQSEDGSVGAYRPSMDEIISEGWDTYSPVPKP